MEDPTRICEGPGCSAPRRSTHPRAKYCGRTCERRTKRARDGDKIRAQEKASKDRHRPAVRQRNADWYSASREAQLLKFKSYYESHRDAYSEYGRRRYAEQGDAIRARVADYRRRNRDKCATWDARYRARRRDATIETFDPVEVFERDGWVCGICSLPIDPQVRYPDQECASLDHIVPLSRDGEHSRENAQASHLRCNKRKHASVT